MSVLHESGEVGLQVAQFCQAGITVTGADDPLGEQPTGGKGLDRSGALNSLVAAHAGGAACVCDLTEPVGLSQATVSHHLKILVDAGILAREQRGKWAYYRLIPDTLTEIARLIAPNHS
jgi:DNA-binding transcriptional ArsR family regulator